METIKKKEASEPGEGSKAIYECKYCKKEFDNEVDRNLHSCECNQNPYKEKL